MFDIFYLSLKSGNPKDFIKLRQKYTSKNIEYKQITPEIK